MRDYKETSDTMKAKYYVVPTSSKTSLIGEVYGHYDSREEAQAAGEFALTSDEYGANHWFDFEVWTKTEAKSLSWRVEEDMTDYIDMSGECQMCYDAGCHKRHGRPEFCDCEHGINAQNEAADTGQQHGPKEAVKETSETMKATVKFMHIARMSPRHGYQVKLYDECLTVTAYGSSARTAYKAAYRKWRVEDRLLTDNLFYTGTTTDQQHGPELPLPTECHDCNDTGWQVCATFWDGEVFEDYCHCATGQAYNEYVTPVNPDQYCINCSAPEGSCHDCIYNDATLDCDESIWTVGPRSEHAAVYAAQGW